MLDQIAGRTRVLSVLDYLDGLLRLRRRSAIDLKEYDEVRFLADLPLLEERLFNAPSPSVDRFQWLELRDDDPSDDGRETYDRLFATYQAWKRLGEDHEWVLACGLLSTKDADGKSIHRHVLTIPVSLNLDSDSGTLSVGPADDEPRWFPEIDMLELDDALIQSRRDLEERLAQGKALFDRDALDEGLALFARRLGGDYFARRRSEVTATERTSIAFAPALLLRKRSNDSLLDVVRRVRAQIGEGGDVAPLLRRICELPPAADRVEPDSGPMSEVSRHPFFPLPMNREQREIHQRLLRADGITVQGPPGTGKTHTIANLICDLLANGQRILVTSKTARALRVLRRMLPAEVQPLCVTSLDGGKEDQDQLEDGVRRIVDRHLRWNGPAQDRRVERLAERLEGLTQEEEELERRLLTLVGRERSEHALCGGAWSGSAARIARRLMREEVEHGWIADDLDEDASLPDVDDLKSYRRMAVELPRERADELAATRPVSKELASGDEFQHLVRRWLEVKRTELPGDRGEPCRIERGASRTDVARLRDLLRSYLGRVEPVVRRNLWGTTALRECLSGDGEAWRELLQSSRERLAGLLEQARIVDEEPLVAKGEVELSSMIGDVVELRAHLANGGRLWGGPFAPEVARRTRYLWRGVRFDGRAPKSVELLDRLLENLRIRQTVQRIWRAWAPHLERMKGTLAAQVVALTEQTDGLRAILDAEPIGREAVDWIARIGGDVGVDLAHLDEVREWEQDAVATLDGDSRVDLERQIERLATPLRLLADVRGHHPIVDDLTLAVENRDVTAWRDGLQQLRGMEADEPLCAQKRELERRLGSVVPRLLREIDATPKDPAWESRLGALAAAFHYAVARTWLRRHRAGDERGLRDRLGRVETRRRQAATELAAALAWRQTFERMTEAQGGRLIAWQQAMRRAATERGVGVIEARNDARRHLRECRMAIPAWVMPLHRVYETLPMECELFDVVIVDEASQCGQEGLPLLQLGKKILVVGDDQQITPTPVGIPRDDVRKLLDGCLGDLEHRDLFGPDSSLFDHAVRRFGDRIVLREHFRCVPEIIRFSDELCYRSTPLIPLRQPPRRRLPPLRAVLVSDGVRSGNGASVVNLPEAELLVDTVIGCARDPRYRGLSFGVIALQGNKQARWIEERLLERLGPAEFASRRITCGNAYAFQGDERDVVFLSLIAAPNEVGAPLVRADFVRRFNVAASRARDQMWLFHSVSPADLSETDLRRRLLEYFLDERPLEPYAEIEEELVRAEVRHADRAIASPPEPFESWLEVDVALDLAEAGYRVAAGVCFGDARIDLVVEGESMRLAIECAGDRHFGGDAASTLEGRRVLERCGWACHTILGSEYYSDQRRAMQVLQGALLDLGIEPRVHAIATPAVREVGLTVDTEERAFESSTLVGSGPETPRVDVPSTRPSRRPRPLRRQEEVVLQPFESWVGADVPDLRKATPDERIDCLRQMIDVEGPTIGDRLIRNVAVAAGAAPNDIGMQLLLDHTLRDAVARGALAVVDDEGDVELGRWTFHLPDRPALVARHRGDRTIAELPTSELLEVMRRVVASRPTAAVEQVFRVVGGIYEFDADDAAVAERLRAIYLRV